ncbi:MAG TPA: cellulose synthase subunit BcsC-related outer membrane protein [Usitatibacter sp.]|nr:cellulose synthase subunit BcsC-related outer membrane protein [Usitatibacter sp.]
MALALCIAQAVPAAGADNTEAAGLLERAEFWQGRGRDDLAREELAKVLRLATDHPEALVAQARLQLRANQEREAAATLERLRKAHPSHPGVAQVAALLRVRGADRDRLRLARQLSRADRNDEAVKAYRAIFPDGFPDDELALEYAQALAATRGGRDSGGELLAQLARKHPNDPRYQVAWASHASRRKPVPPAILRTLRELAEIPAVARQAREAWRRTVLAMDPVEATLPALREYIEANPGETPVQERLDEVMQALARERRLLSDPGFTPRRDGLAALEAGKLEEAEPLLLEAITHHPDDAELAGAMGLLRLRQARHGEAHDEFRRAQRLGPAQRARWEGLANTARYWGLMREASRAREAGTLDIAEARVREAMALDPSEPAARAELARTHEAAMRRRGEQLREQAKAMQAQSRNAEAILALEEAAALDPLDPWLALDLARLHAAQGAPQRGEALFTRLLEKQPAHADTRFAMALFLSGVEREAQALQVLEAIPAAERSEGMRALQARLEQSRVRGELSITLRRSEELRAAGRDRDAMQLVEETLQAHPHDAVALAVASRLSERLGDVGQAVAYEERSLAIEPSTETWRVRRYAGLHDQMLTWHGAGIDMLYRSGTDGTSRMGAQELSLGHREPWSRAGRAFFRVAPTRITNGILVERGAAFTAGLEHETFRIDLGSTPLGFPIANLVGGAVYKGELGRMSYSIDVSRRPVVSSLLSYAGTRDPATGRTWGGVVATGARVNVSRDQGGDYGAWGLAGLYRLSGRDVRDNDKAELMAGAYRRLMNEEDRQLAAGVTTMLWRFTQNAGEFTLGHGGYYSPREYASIGFPVSFGMRGECWSAYVRGSVSLAWSKSFEDGDDGHSYGRSLSMAAERRLTPNLFIGARVDIERSTNYTPNRVLLYVRVTPGEGARSALALPPEPVVLPGFQH